MSFGDLSLNTTPKNRKLQSTYIHTSTVEDLSYTPSAREQTRDAAQIAATGRRSWKTLRGKGEAVWPPNLCVQRLPGTSLQAYTLSQGGGFD